MTFSQEQEAAWAASRNRGVARGRALQRLACRHVEEFQDLWAEEAAKLQTTAGQFRGVPERVETGEERNARLAAEASVLDRQRRAVTASLLDVLRPR